LEKVRVKGKEVRIEINPAFYSYEAVLLTKKILKDVCQVSVRKKEDVILVSLKPKPKMKINLETLGYEFYNYLLNSVKEMRLGLI